MNSLNGSDHTLWNTRMSITQLVIKWERANKCLPYNHFGSRSEERRVGKEC